MKPLALLLRKGDPNKFGVVKIAIKTLMEKTKKKILFLSLEAECQKKSCSDICEFIHATLSTGLLSPHLFQSGKDKKQLWVPKPCPLTRCPSLFLVLPLFFPSE